MNSTQETIQAILGPDGQLVLKHQSRLPPGPVEVMIRVAARPRGGAAWRTWSKRSGPSSAVEASPDDRRRTSVPKKRCVRPRTRSGTANSTPCAARYRPRGPECCDMEPIYRTTNKRRAGITGTNHHPDDKNVIPDARPCKTPCAARRVWLRLVVWVPASLLPRRRRRATRKRLCQEERPRSSIPPTDLARLRIRTF